MMSIIADIAEYFCANYPHQAELSKARLTKLVYLADWEFAKSNGRQITDIQWYFHNFGPYVDDVVDEVKADKRFKMIDSVNFYGDKKTTIALSSSSKKSELNDAIKEILDRVISDTRSMYWNDFIKHVYATRPVAKAVRYTYLDLEAAASEVKLA